MPQRPISALACLLVTIAATVGCVWVASLRRTLPLGDVTGGSPPRFRLTDEGLARLRASATPSPVLISLQPLHDVHVPNESVYRSRLEELLSSDDYQRYGTSIVAASRQSDSDFYRDVLDRMRSGQNYYDATNQTFRDIGFVSTSVFNWRLPTLAWLCGRWLGPLVAQKLLLALAAATLLLWLTAARRDFGPRWAVLVVALVGPLAWGAIDHVYLFTETWAGTLIALSIGAYGLGHRRLGIGAALAALFFRELALPFCLICAGAALLDRRRAEAAAWAIGLTVFAAFFAWHAREVGSRLPSVDGDTTHWIRFGGLTFVIGISQMNVFLIALPSWIPAALLPSSLLGLLGWKGSTSRLLLMTSFVYLAVFAVAGLPNNAYWGLMVTPVLALGWVGLPFALRDLGRTLRPTAWAA